MKRHPDKWDNLAREIKVKRDERRRNNEMLLS